VGGKVNVIGSSNGGSLVAYSLEDYANHAGTSSLSSEVAIGVLDSSPTFSHIGEGCLDQSPWQYTSGQKGYFDLAAGFTNPPNGPCINADSSFTSTWASELWSLEYGRIFAYPGTDYHVFYGTADVAVVLARAPDWDTFLTGKGQAHTMHLISGGTHGCYGTQACLDALKAVLAP
jgi:hypothetical protein